MLIWSGRDFLMIDEINQNTVIFVLVWSFSIVVVDEYELWFLIEGLNSLFDKDFWLKYSKGEVKAYYNNFHLRYDAKNHETTNAYYPLSIHNKTGNLNR